MINKCLSFIVLAIMFSCGLQQKEVAGSRLQGENEIILNDSLSLVLFFQDEGAINTIIIRTDEKDKIIGFHEDGVTPAIVATEKLGKRDGLCRTYYPNGRLNVLENYVNGMKDGVQESYTNNGGLTYKAIYDKGKQTEIIVGISDDEDLELLE